MENLKLKFVSIHSIHPPKCLQIGRPLYNDSSWQAWPKSYDFWSTISWVATRRKERSFQDRYCKSLPELRNRASEQGGNGIMISCGWWAPTRYKQGYMTPLIGVKKKNRKNHVFKAIYRGYTITPFRYNDLLGAPTLVVNFGVIFQVPGRCSPKTVERSGLAKFFNGSMGQTPERVAYLK